VCLTNGTSLDAKPDWDKTCEHFASWLLGLIPKRTMKNPYVSRLANNKSCNHNKIWSLQNPALEIGNLSLETTYA
jgi:hypothetical protein